MRALSQAILATQEMERNKLHLTAQLQIVRHGLAMDALRNEYADTDDGEGDAATRSTSGGLAYAVGSMGGDIVAGSARASAMRAAEANELKQKLHAVTEELNDALDEIRAELADIWQDNNQEGWQ